MITAEPRDRLNGTRLPLPERGMRASRNAPLRLSLGTNSEVPRVPPRPTRCIRGSWCELREPEERSLSFRMITTLASHAKRCRNRAVLVSHEKLRAQVPGRRTRRRLPADGATPPTRPRRDKRVSSRCGCARWRCSRGDPAARRRQFCHRLHRQHRRAGPSRTLPCGDRRPHAAATTSTHRALYRREGLLLGVVPGETRGVRLLYAVGHARTIGLEPRNCSESR